MMIKHPFLILFAICSIATGAQESDISGPQPADVDANNVNHYISDDLFIYMHSGPGTNYRILGSVEAGTIVTILAASEDAEFTQIQDNRGRSGWVKSEYVKAGESLRVQVSNLTSQLDATRQSDNQLSSTIAQLEMELVTVQDENTLLQGQIAQLRQDADALNQQLSMQASDSERDWFMRGGVVSVGGVLFGIIITLLLRRKKRSEGFYDRY